MKPVVTPLEDLATAQRPPEVPAPATRERVAVVIAHGMGQQVPFETLEGVASAIRAAAQVAVPVTTQFVSASAAGDGTAGSRPADHSVIPRAELTLGSTEVHLYESYWAPLTEGRVGAGDVMGFLWGAVVNAVRHGMRIGYQRVMFSQVVTFPASSLSVWAIFGLGAVLAALVVLVAMAAAVGIAGVLNWSPASWATPTLVAIVSVDLLVIEMLVFLSVVIAIALPGLYRRNGVAFAIPPVPIKLLAWMFIALAVLVIGGAPIVVGTHMLTTDRARAEVADARAHTRADQAPIAVHAVSAADSITTQMCYPGLVRSATWLKSNYNTATGRLVILGIWIMAALLVRKARNILIQYPGDVAAYISAHRVSKFAEIRDAIQARMLAILDLVYSRKLAYDRVIVVGHSLGSVVAYDGLNKLTLLDRLSGGTLDVAQRTALLLTFGSPLDKIAYAFRVQRPEDCLIREALAQARQPFIDVPAYIDRPRRWINLYSRHDLIGANLDYFDLPDGDEGGAQRVCNVMDPEAFTPLLAHSEHWQGGMLGYVLHTAILTGAPPDAAALRAWKPAWRPTS